MTERQQPRQSKRAETKHVDKYADLLTENRLASLVEHFTSEERARERR